MAKNTSKKNTKKKNTKKDIEAQRDLKKKREIQSLIIIAFGIFLGAALFFDITGVVGEYLKIFLTGCFGHAAYALPVYLLVYGALMLVGRTKVLRPVATVFFLLLFIDASLLNSLRYVDGIDFNNMWIVIKGSYKTGIALNSGGIIGMFFAVLLVKAVGKIGAILIGATLILISIIVISDKPYAEMAGWEEKSKERQIKRKVENNMAKQEQERIQISSEPPVENVKTYENRKRILGYMNDDSIGTGRVTEDEPPQIIEAVSEPEPLKDSDIPSFISIENETEPPKRRKRKTVQMSMEELDEQKKIEEEIASSAVDSEYVFPSVDLLKSYNVKKTDIRDIAEKTRILEQTLKSFKVDAKVVETVPGPTVTRYEIQPGTGVKVSSIVRLQNDIALNLRAKSIRIEAPIPGKAAVGIEVENDNVTMVSIREIIESDAFQSAKSKISFSVGKSITGDAIVGNLKSMPHLLIAGSTGSGKSVCINSIITSILYKASPEEVKLVLIDPKVVELGIYNGIPHLLIPVVTEPAKAAAALNWAVAEMNDRYKKFAKSGVRDLESYNEHMKVNGEEILPQVVIIIDELADLMMAAPSQVEDSICRLAQMARAAGMHLIVATQRPSVDVITGVIKANIPSRIAFAVSSQVDSRTILDMAGAEKLVGKGDMLYSPLGLGKPERIQGCYISDDEVNRVITHVKSQESESEYSKDVIDTIEGGEIMPVTDNDDGDELMKDCIEFVVSAGQASVSMLQRRFRIGYNRAARIMDIMEERGIVGPQDGSRPRQVILTEEELHGYDSEENIEE